MSLSRRQLMVNGATSRVLQQQSVNAPSPSVGASRSPCLRAQTIGFSAPVLIVHGEKVAGVPLPYGERAANCFQNASLEVIPNAGHWTQRDYPEIFNRLMLAFLAGD